VAAGDAAVNADMQPHHLQMLEDSIIESAIRELNADGGADSTGVVLVLANRLARVYALHMPAEACSGHRECWCPECGEIGAYPNPCATARLAIGQRDA
jgi:hypothetical protein